MSAHRRSERNREPTPGAGANARSTAPAGDTAHRSGGPVVHALTAATAVGTTKPSSIVSALVSEFDFPERRNNMSDNDIEFDEGLQELRKLADCALANMTPQVAQAALDDDGRHR